MLIGKAVMKEKPKIILLEGALLAGMEKSKLNSTWGIYKGDVENSEGSISSIYLKPRISKTDALREFFASFIAQACGLKVPSPYLVKVPNDYGPTSSQEDFSGQYIFGMEIKEYPDLSRNVSAGFFKDTEFGNDFFKNKDVSIACVFDEILDNKDRHHENLLFNGSAVFFIDHQEVLRTCSEKGKIDFNAWEKRELGEKNWFVDISSQFIGLKGNSLEKRVLRNIRENGFENIPKEAYDNFWSSFVRVSKCLNLEESVICKRLAITYYIRSKNIKTLIKKTFDKHGYAQFGLNV